MRVKLFACLTLAVVLIVGLTFITEAEKKKEPAITSSPASSVSVKVPVEEEVCFSPDEPCDAKLVKFVESAEKSIAVAIYDINLDQLVQALILKAKTKTVRIVVDRRQSRSDKHSLVGLLIKEGVSMRYGDQKGIMHDKFIIVDNKMVETGSFNFTSHAAASNQENQVYLANSAIVKHYAQRFEMIWNSAKEY